MRRRPQGDRYQWSATCPCGSSIKLSADHPQTVQDIAEVWRRYHPEDQEVHDAR